MAFERSSIFALTLAFAWVAMPSSGAAQEEAEDPLYVQVDCMKSITTDYPDVETEIWKPIHQEAVKQGELVGWALYWVLYGDRSDCDYYTVNTYRGLEQLNAERPFAELFAIAHPDKNWAEATERTAASRHYVRSELWVWIDGVLPTDHQFVGVNQMHTDSEADYVRFERETWKPVHQALVDEGHSAGWGFYGLISPHGTSVPYNYGTVDFMKRLGPVPIAETMAAVHPEREVSALMQEGLDVRDHVYGETWVLIASTE